MTALERPRYAKLGYVALNVTDIARSRHFYEGLLGLEVTDTGPAGELFLRCSDGHHDIILYPSTTPGLRRIGWQVETDRDIDLVMGIAQACDMDRHEASEVECEILGQGRTLRIKEPLTGAWMEYYSRQNPGGNGAYKPTVAKILRLGHLVLRLPDYAEAVQFYTGQMNFRISDQIDGRTTFMRCFPNPYHHSFGLGKGPKRALHHINFMVSDIDDIGRALWRMQQNDVPIVYGPGRHPPSDSVFLYFTDPDGMTCEYSFGMEEFPEVGARPARLLAPVPSSIDDWGGPPPRFDPVVIANDELPAVAEAAIHQES